MVGFRLRCEIVCATLIGLALFSLIWAAAAAGAEIRIEVEPASVHVIDGDTVVVGQDRVRLPNIDTPELRGRCEAEVKLAIAAKLQVMRRVALATAYRHEVVLMARARASEPNEVARDRYGRILARLVVDGRDVGAELIEEGLARPWRGRRQPWCEP